jgi:integrase
MIRNTIGQSWIANTKLTALTREDVARFHRELGSRPPLANRTVKLLGTMLNYGASWGLTEKGSYICRIALYRERGRERYLRSNELERLGKTLDDLEHEKGESPHVVAAIRLLLLTGARPSEILTLRWSHVDYDRAMLHLPDSKTGPRVIYLSKSAIDVLRKVPQGEGNPFVIHGGIPGQHRVTLERPWQRIRARACLKDVRLYDLRHTYASVAAGVGLSLPVIGRLLGHKNFETTARYAHLAAEPLHLATDFVGTEIEEALRGELSPSEVARWRLPGRNGSFRSDL